MQVQLSTLQRQQALPLTQPFSQIRRHRQASLQAVDPRPLRLAGGLLLLAALQAEQGLPGTLAAAQEHLGLHKAPVGLALALQVAVVAPA